MTNQKTLLHMVILGTAVMAPLFSHVEISSGQDIYSATALLRVLPPKTARKYGIPSPDIMNRQVQNYTKTILCEKIVAEALGPENSGKNITDWKKELLEKHPDLINILLREVRVSQLPGTDFIGITLEGRDRMVITEIVNAIAKAAVEDARNDTQTSISDFLNVILFERENLEKIRKNSEVFLSQLDGRIPFPPHKPLVAEQRFLSQKKITIQLKLIAARIRLKNLPAGEKKLELQQQATKQIQKCEAQIDWLHREIEKKTELIRDYACWRERREEKKRELRMIEKTLQSLDRRIMNLRIRLRTEKPLEWYRRALPPDKPIKKIKGRKSKTSL